MFSVNNIPIFEDEQTVIEELRRQVTLNGHYLFDTVKPSGNNLMTNCPFHKGGQERKPSFGISKVDMKCHCFTCGWAGTLDKMISNVFGHDDDGSFGREWLAKNFVTISIEQRKPINLRLSRGSVNQIKQVKYVTEEELDRYRYFHPYMYKRGLTDEIIEEFDIGYDSATDCITFPVYDINRNCVFVARRSVKYKFFNYPEDVEKPVYCAERFVSGRYNEAIICESFLNTLTCWKYGKPSVALIGTGTDEQYRILKQLPVRKYIIATDPDEAGERAANKLRKALSDTKVVTQYYLPPGKDMNDLQADILELQEYF